MKGLEKGPSSARSGSAIDPRYKGVASEAIAKAPPPWAAFLMACTPLSQRIHSNRYPNPTPAPPNTREKPQFHREIR